MKKLIIIITIICIGISFYIPIIMGDEFHIKGQGNPIAYKKKYLSKESNIDVIRDKKNGADGVLSKKLHEDLASKAGINFDAELHGKTKESLIVFLNSEGSLPNGMGVKNDGLSHGNSLLSLRTFLGLPKNSKDSLSIIQIVSKIGLSAILWANPIVGAVSSTVLSLAFNQSRDNEQYSDSQRKKKEDEIFSDIYKYSINDEGNKLLPNGIGLNIKDMDKIKISLSELQDRVNQAVISQRSLMMLASRLAESDLKNHRWLQDISPINQTVSIQSPLIMRCFQNNLSLMLRNSNRIPLP